MTPSYARVFHALMLILALAAIVAAPAAVADEADAPI